MKTYLNALGHILANGKVKEDRTGTGTKGVFGYQMHFDLEKGFPAVTTKTLAWKSVVSELLWLLEGSTDERRLAEIRYGEPREELIDKTTIWTANADNQGKAMGYENTDTVKELGPVYGKQWRDCDGIDQIAEIIAQIKADPDKAVSFFQNSRISCIRGIQLLQRYFTASKEEIQLITNKEPVPNIKKVRKLRRI